MAMRPGAPPTAGRRGSAFGIALVLGILLSYAPSAGALHCYQCGLYTDGVGSITPCVNYTAEKHLKECPSTESHCIKYVSEGSTVRDCAHECAEKESWGIKIYCCQLNGCNGAESLHGGGRHLLWLLPSAAILAHLATKLLQRQHL